MKYHERLPKLVTHPVFLFLVRGTLFGAKGCLLVLCSVSLEDEMIQGK